MSGLSTVLMAFAVALSAPGAAARAACEGGAWDLPQRLLGTWHEFAVEDGEERLVGTLTVERLSGGCSVSQRFDSADGDFAFVTLATVEETRGVWVERMLFTTGQSRTYEWRAVGDDIVFDRVEEDGSTGTKRLRATEFGAEGFVVLEEVSEDGGRTWQVLDRTPTRPVDVAPARLGP